MNANRESLPAPTDALQQEMRTQLAAVTGGMAPEPYVQAWWNWLLDVSQSPDAREQLLKSAVSSALDTWQFSADAAAGKASAPAPDDKRFANEAWNQWPFNVYARAYKNWESWLTQSVNINTNLDSRSSQLAKFVAQQMTEAASPSNFLHTNPELLEQTRQECGQNLVRGYQNWVDDLKRMLENQPVAGTEAFVPGREVAATPGKVVLRNNLIELIQYAPQTPTVYAEPILIVAPWIMKYYILDLSPANSLVRFLVDKGHTVFMVSWKNPTAVDRDLGIGDYYQLGLLDALDAVSAIVPDRRIHLTGYCIGGTLSYIGASALAQAGDQRIGTISMFASLCDFSEPGELSLFIDTEQLATLDAAMSKKGYLESKQMGGAFQMLRSYDLIWSPIVTTYIRGERGKLNDLMAWNADGTRMPACMHSEYLHQLYLENRLAKGEFELDGQTLKLSDLTQPMFLLGTETDHVTPWQAVYKARQHTRSTDFTFVLTSGGHNAGVISGPVNPKRRHRVLHLTDATTQVSPEEFVKTTAPVTGSWWPVWEQWIADHSSSEATALPSMGNEEQGYAPVADAPGTYVLQR